MSSGWLLHFSLISHKIGQLKYMLSTLIIKYVLIFPRKHIVESKYRVISNIIGVSTRGLVFLGVYYVVMDLNILT